MPGLQYSEYSFRDAASASRTRAQTSTRLRAFFCESSRVKRISGGCGAPSGPGCKVLDLAIAVWALGSAASPIRELTPRWCMGARWEEPIEPPGYINTPWRKITQSNATKRLLLSTPTLTFKWKPKTVGGTLQLELHQPGIGSCA